jgi:hypothetical protein
MSNQSIPAYFTNTSTIDTYFTTKFFDDYVLQKEYYPYQFNSRQGNINYGLVNSRGFSVFPKRSALETYAGANGTNQRNLLFVVDAFNNLKSYYRNVGLGSSLGRNGSIYNQPEAVTSSRDVDELYVKYLNDLYSIYSSTFLTQSKRNSIKDAYTFSKTLVEFFSVIVRVVTITRSSFINNKNCPLEVSGLVISLENNNDYSNLQNIANNYISDSSFEVFLDSVKRFGFFVDKNAPWRIVCDLASPVTLEYASRYGLSSIDDIFSKFYHVAHESDLDVLKNVVISFWNTFITETPVNVSQTQQVGCSKLFAEISANSELTDKSFDAIFSRKWLIRLYLYLKVLESKVKLDQNKFEIIYQDAVKYDQYFGSSTNFINTKILELLNREQLQESQREVLTTPDDISKLLLQQTSAASADTLTF